MPPIAYDDAMTIQPMPHDPFPFICAAIRDAATYIDQSLRPRPFNDDPYFIHFHDDDTDYLPAASDFIAILLALICDDYPEPAYARFFDALANCRSIDDATDCYHTNAIDFHHALEPFIRPDDECPHMNP